MCERERIQRKTDRGKFWKTKIPIFFRSEIWIWKSKKSDKTKIEPPHRDLFVAFAQNCLYGPAVSWKFGRNFSAKWKLKFGLGSKGLKTKFTLAYCKMYRWQVYYDSRVVIYNRRGFIGLPTLMGIFKVQCERLNKEYFFKQSLLPTSFQRQ